MINPIFTDIYQCQSVCNIKYYFCEQDAFKSGYFGKQTKYIYLLSNRNDENDNFVRIFYENVYKNATWSSSEILVQTFGNFHLYFLVVLSSEVFIRMRIVFIKFWRTRIFTCLAYTRYHWWRSVWLILNFDTGDWSLHLS